MTDPRDVLSSDLRQYLNMYKRGALSVLRGLRSGVINNKEAALSLINIYNSVEWKIEQYDYGAAHPYCIFTSRVLRSAKLLMGEEWVDYHR